jgi:hypothetical protein
MYRINEFHIRFTKDLTRVLAIKKLAQNHFALLSKKTRNIIIFFYNTSKPKSLKVLMGFECQNNSKS